MLDVQIDGVQYEGTYPKKKIEASNYREPATEANVPTQSPSSVSLTILNPKPKSICVNMTNLMRVYKPIKVASEHSLGHQEWANPTLKKKKKKKKIGFSDGLDSVGLRNQHYKVSIFVQPTSN
jgi:hypothetical protein